MTKPRLYAGIRTLLQVRGCAVLLAAAVLSASTLHAQTPCATCIVPSLTPGQSLALPARLNGLEILIRVPASALRDAAAALDAVKAHEGAGGLHIVGIPTTIDAASFDAATRVIVDVVEQADADPDALAFQLKKALTALRAAVPPSTRIGVALSTSHGRALLARDLGSYVDTIVWTTQAPESPATEAWGTIRQPVDDVAALLRAAGARTATEPRQLWPVPEDAADAARWLGDLAAAAPFLPAGLVPGAGAPISCGGRAIETYLNPETLDSIALVTACVPQVTSSGSSTSQQIETVRLSSGTAIVRIAAAQDRIAEGVQVRAARQLSVDEIIARHQAAAARQAAIVRESIASGTMTLTFEAPGFPAPIAISSAIAIYTGRDRTEIEQRDVRVNGIAFPGGGIPKLPIIEPERVASPPLAITLTNVYRYELAGRETIEDTPCYVVAFSPIDAKRALFRGRVWIAADSFSMVKVAAAQTGLRGPIVSSEQTDEFRRDDSGRWLLARSEVRQIYEGAAHRTPIHRVMEIRQHEVNPSRFAERRGAAYGSNSVMLRDTPEGYRYLRRQPETARSGGTAGVTPPEVVGGATRVRTLIAGVIVDPNISRPLPFAGLSYVDFNLLGSGAQLNAFFGGTYGQVAFSVPSLGGTRWQLAGRGFGIASSYNDRAFVDGREQYAQNIRQRPAHASVWLLRPVTARVSVRAGYELDYTHFGASDITAADFAVPADQVNHGARLALEGQRGGWNASLWWNPVRRSGWREWGTEGGQRLVGPEDDRGSASTDIYDPRHRDFQRYGLTVTRSAVLTPRVVVRVEAAWMAGRDLDRFSRYAFGAFDNRLRGYPSALIRYDRGGVLRGAVAWSPGRLLRFDGFADTAYVRDPGFGRAARSYTGLGAAIEAPAPFGTLVAVEWGYGLQGVNADGGRGTQVVRVSAFKLF